MVVAVASLVLTLEQPRTVVCVDTVAVSDEQDYVFCLVGVNVLVLLLVRLDGRSAVRAVINLMHAAHVKIM